MKRSRKISCWVLGILILLLAPMAVPDILFLLRPLPRQANPEAFHFPEDRFAFANETVWNYADGELQNIGLSDEAQEAADGERYSRRCFVLARAALQFHKFARFDPAAKPLDDQTLTDRINDLVSIDVWKSPLPMGDRLVFPGYADLNALSQAHPEILQDHLGPGWTTYIRPGNFGITLPVSDGHQEKVHRLLEASLEQNVPVVLWLVNFPSLDINHTVLVYEKRGVEGKAGGTSRYSTYDPNDTTEPKS